MIKSRELNTVTYSLYSSSAGLPRHVLDSTSPWYRAQVWATCSSLSSLRLQNSCWVLLSFSRCLQFLRRRDSELRGQTPLVCLVFPCAHIRDMQVGQGPTHMTLWPSPVSPLQVCGVHLPPSRWCQLGWGKTPLVFSTISTDWRQFSLFTEKHFETTHIPWLSPTPPTPFRIHWWLSLKPILTTIDGKLWLCSPTPTMFIASTQPWRPLLLPHWPTYFLNYSFACLLSAWTYSPLLSWFPLMILLSQIWPRRAPMSFQHPHHFSYISHAENSSPPSQVSPYLPHSGPLYFFFHSQREPLFTSDTDFHFKASSVEQAFWILTWSHWSIFSFIATINFYTLFK